MMTSLSIQNIQFVYCNACPNVLCSINFVDNLFIFSSSMQRVPVDKMSEDEINDLLASYGIVKRSQEEADAEEDLEPWEDDHKEL